MHKLNFKKNSINTKILIILRRIKYDPLNYVLTYKVKIKYKLRMIETFVLE